MSYGFHRRHSKFLLNRRGKEEGKNKINKLISAKGLRRSIWKILKKVHSLWYALFIFSEGGAKIRT